ncbi:hypothetical protein [Longimicrobium sp.]|uniref:hypothetical protein n=1 Tax=Longimicrobium sp. TaxID=2029185 RepID=UPI002B743899|nr:hypothetical protein [Longimicrobium sp.]HSU17499.1 hypothetical protein [Longimicrobium sp.]
MSNQTFEERLVRDHPAEPLEGHNVVVFERVGESGEKFRTILPPGTPLKRGLLERLWPQGRFFAIAVDASPDLHLDVNQHVVLEDEEAHRFDLLLDLYYSVSDPHLLASLRNRDPLGLVSERARQVIGRDVRQLQWTEIVFGFAVSAQEVLRHRLPELRAFAAAYGIVLRTVEVGRLLPEEATRPAAEEERELDKIRRGERVTVAGMDSARRIGDAANLHTLGSADMDTAAQDVRDTARIRAAAVDGRIRAIGAVAGEVSTPDEFRAVFQGGIHPVGTPGATPGMLSVPDTSTNAALTPGTGGLSALLQQVVWATQNVSGSGRRLELRSALLHLVAEVLLEDLAEPAMRTRYADRAHQLFASLERSLVPHELDALRTLCDPAELERSLRG